MLQSGEDRHPKRGCPAPSLPVTAMAWHCGKMLKKVAQLAKRNLESLIWASRSHYLLGLGDFAVAIFSVGFRG